MKRLIAFTVALAAAIIPAFAQFGITGGFTSSNTTLKSFSDFKPESVSLFHAGLLYKFDIGAGFALQPTLLYQVKGASLDQIVKKEDGDIKTSIDTKTGYIEFNAGLQWGPDLIAFRPYIFAEPFIGYAVYNEEETKGDKPTLADVTEADATEYENAKITAWTDSAKQRLEYGIGVGGGIEFSHVQISVQYFLNFGPLYNTEGKVDGNEVLETVRTAFKDKNYQGLKVSLAVLF